VTDDSELLTAGRSITEPEPVLSASDLFDAQACGRLPKTNEIARFRDSGVDPDALLHPHPLRADWVAFLSDGLFEFARYLEDTNVTVEPAFTLVVTTTYGAIDIAAWQPQANRIGLWLNRAVALGEEQILAPRLGDEALAVRPTPMSWLRARRRGIVILRPSAAFFYLRDVPSLCAEDFAHAEELERILNPTKAKTKIVLPDRRQNNDGSAAA
jgi:hypothetical protein